MAELRKDRNCIGCKRFFDCKGKPHGNPCLNKEEEKRSGGTDKQR